MRLHAYGQKGIVVEQAQGIERYESRDYDWDHRDRRDREIPLQQARLSNWNKHAGLEAMSQ